MASIEQRGKSYRIIFRFDGQRTAGNVGTGCRVWQVPISYLAIPPIVKPLAIQWGRLDVGHPHFHGRARVAAVTESFTVWAVDDIAAQGQAAVGPVGGVVDLVQQFIRARKLRCGGVVCRDPMSDDILRAGCDCQSLDMHPAEGMVVESRLEGLGRRAVEHIFIILIVGLKLSIQSAPIQ